MALLRSRAIENQAFVIGCNRVGTGGGLNYAGDSRVINPLGEVIAEAGNQSTVLYADISSEEVQTVRNTFPFMQDRR
jgi:predicted amidohydrolase